MKKLEEMNKSNKIIIILILIVVSMLLFISYNTLANNDNNPANGNWTLSVKNNNNSVLNNQDNTTNIYIDYNNIMVDMDEVIKCISKVYISSPNFNTGIRIIDQLMYNKKYPNGSNPEIKTGKGFRTYDWKTPNVLSYINENENEKYFHLPDIYNYYYDENNYVEVDDSVDFEIEENNEKRYLPLYFFANIPGIVVYVDGTEVYNKNNYKIGFEAIKNTQSEHEVSISITQITEDNYPNLAKSTTSYYGEEEGALWREEALKRIEKYRKHNLTVSVIKKSDNTHLGGASISIERLNNDFSFGTMITSDSNTSLNTLQEELLLFNSVGVNSLFKDDNNLTENAIKALKEEIKGINKIRGNYIYNDNIDNKIVESIIGTSSDVDLSDDNITMGAVRNYLSSLLSQGPLSDANNQQLDEYTTKLITRYEKVYTDYIASLINNETYKNIDSYDVINNISVLSKMYILLYNKQYLGAPNYNTVTGSFVDDDVINESYVTFLKNIIKKFKDKGYTKEIVFSDTNSGLWNIDETNIYNTNVTNKIISLIKAIDNSYYSNQDYTNSVISAYSLKYKPNSNYATPQSYYNELNKILDETKISHGKIDDYDNSANTNNKESLLRDTLIMAYSNPRVNEFYFDNYFDNTTAEEKNIYKKFINGDYFYVKKGLLSYNESTTSSDTIDYETGLYDGNYKVTVTIGNITQTENITIPREEPNLVFKIPVDGLDLTDPTVGDISSTVNNGETTVEFQCSDNVGLKGYYFGEEEPTKDDFINFGTNHDTVLATVSKEGNYYYGCIDTSGRSTLKNVEFNKYVFSKYLQKLDGQEGAYNSNNYDLLGNSSTYFVKNGYKVGEPSGFLDGFEYQGIAISGNSTLSDEITIDSNKEINAYYDRKVYEITLVAVEGVNNVELSSENTSVRATSTISDNNKKVNIRHGTRIIVTANLLDGKEFDRWSGLSLSTANPVEITPENGGYLTPVLNSVNNNVAPIANITNNSTGLKLNSLELKIRCTDDTNVSAYYFGKDSNPSSYTTVSGSNTFENTINVNESGTYYLYCKDNNNAVSENATIKINNYIVKKMLLKENGNISNHTTSNYELVENNTYIGQDNLILLIDTLKNPIPNYGGNYLGHSIGDASNTNVELTTSDSTTNINPSNNTNNRVYTLWYDRTSNSESTTNVPSIELLNVSNKGGSKNQTVMFKCNCSENITKTYIGTKSNPSDSDYLPIESENIGKEYQVASVIDNPGKYYFGCMSASGEKSLLISQEFVSYNINKELLSITGEKGTINSTNYKEVSSDSYLLAKDKSLIISDVNKSTPTGSNETTYRGYTTESSNITKDNPTISGNETITMWFDRIEYNVTLMATSYVPKIEAKNQNGDIITATLENNNKEIVTRYGEKLELTATTRDGTTINWGNYSNSTDNTISMSPTSNLVIRIDEPKDGVVENPKTGSISNYIKYVLIISLVLLLVMFMSFKSYSLK